MCIICSYNLLFCYYPVRYIDNFIDYHCLIYCYHFLHVVIVLFANMLLFYVLPCIFLYLLLNPFIDGCSA